MTLAKYIKGILMILIAAGGTGGHLIPAISMAAAFSKIHQKDITLLGTKTSIDEKIYTSSGYPYQILPFHRPSAGLSGKIKLTFELLNSIRIVKKIIKEKKVKAVIACGGFGCIAAGIAAKLTKTPLFILEQNAIPGRTNLFLSKMAKTAYVEFSHSMNLFKHCPAKHLGNPINDELAKCSYQKKASAILFMGGSQGASFINQLAKNISPKILNEFPDSSIIHITGQNEFEKYSHLNGPRYQVIPFCDDMIKVYQRTKITIARSGATSIAELSAIGIPSFFIPYPYAKDNHQEANAKELCDLGAAKMFLEKNFKEDEFVFTLTQHLEDQTSLNQIQLNFKKWAKPLASTDISTDILRQISL